jgi:CRISPR-associated endonuclease/helicase Cas3
MNISDKRNPAAHLKQDGEGVWLEHGLDDHLTGVAKIAADFASEFGNADWAMAAGMLHDLGKYNPKWQEYLRKSSGDYLEDSDGQD